MVAEGTRRELVSKLGERDRIELGATGDLDALACSCRQIPAVDSATVADGSVQVIASEARAVLPSIVEAAASVGVALDSVQVVEPDLEAVFLHLTGTALRE